MLSIAFTGIDGSGKSTAAFRVARTIQEHGLRVKSVWFRWRAFFSYGPYAYGRVAGFTMLRPNEKVRGTVRVNEFYRSRVLRGLYPWTQLFDMLLFYFLLQLRFVLERTSVVLYDRFLIDMLIDVSHKTGRRNLSNSILGQIVLAFSRDLDSVIFFDIDPLIAYRREKGGDVLSESELIEKRALYLKAMSQLGNVRIVDAGQTKDNVVQQVLDHLDGLSVSLGMVRKKILDEEFVKGPAAFLPCGSADTE